MTNPVPLAEKVVAALGDADFHAALAALHIAEVLVRHREVSCLDFTDSRNPETEIGR